MSPSVDRVATCKMFHIDWDRWLELSIEAQGIHLAWYREKRNMEGWTQQEHDRKALIRQLQTKGSK